MKTGPAVAVGVGAGYLLGRTRKMKVAIALAVAATTGRAGGPGKLLGGASPLSQLSPELGKLTGSVRDGLLQAGKAAAVSAASNRIESVAGRLHERTEGLRGSAAGDSAEPDGDLAAEDEEERPRARRERPSARRAAKEPAEETAEEPEEETASSTRRRRPAGTAKSPVRRTGR
jgi:hypothetical protein